MRKISSESSQCRMVEMSELSLTVWQEVSRLLETLSRLNQARTSCLMQSMVMSIPAQPTWELVCVPLSMLTFLDIRLRDSRSWRPDVKNFTSSPVEPEENLVDRLVVLMTFQTSTDLDTPRLSWSRR